MQNFANTVTYHADKIEQILISDLHLPLIEPVSDTLGQAFLSLLDNCLALPNLKTLYILGDWFEAWLGDDVAEMPIIHDRLLPMVLRLRQLQQRHCDILVMVGNRDFLLGQTFCDKFGAKLINAPFYFDLANEQDHKTIRLEHGDALCTDDKRYQRFRRVIQHPLTKKCLLALPITKREQIAQNLRQKSQTDNAKKSLHIMDVNIQAVANALKRCDMLLHGHTHRPATHQVNGKQRIVLGDWRIIDNGVVAEIGVVVAGELQLVSYQFNTVI